MPRSRLRWRALAVLGALLSVMIDWPIGFAMPAAGGSQLPLMTNAKPYARFSCMNCSSSGTFNLTNSDRFAANDRGSASFSNSNNSSGNSGSDSGTSTNNNSKRSSKSDRANEAMIMPSTTLSTIEKGIISNSNRSIPPERLMRVYNKRKRKKLTVARVTADLLRSIRTHNNHSLSSDVNNLINHNFNNISESLIVNNNDSDESSNNYNPSVDSTTTMHAILGVTEDSLITSTETPVTLQHLSRTDRSVHQQHTYRRVKVNNGFSNNSSSNDTNLDRNERSANLSHISGPARKIQLFIKNRWIQMLPDGTINGTQDDSSDYTILQRTTVNVGQIKIQGVATCLFLCMDQCGAVYGSKAFTDDCVFNESMEQHHYNTYSSTYNSNSRRTLYLALNRHGVPRKLQIPPSRPLGKLATYTKAMTSIVEEDRVEKLIARTFGANRVKHGLRQLCDAGKPLIELTAKVLRTRPKCNLLNNSSGQTAAATTVAGDKLTRIGSSSNVNSSNSHSSSNNNNGNARKKKKKRRCRPNENEQEHNCHRPGPQALRKRAQNRKCLPTQTPEECALARKKGGKKHNKGAHHKKRKNNGAAGNNRRAKAQSSTKNTLTTTTASSTTLSTTPQTTSSREIETSTTTTTTTVTTSPRVARTQSIRQQLGAAFSQEETVSTEDSQQLHMQSSTEVHEGSEPVGNDDEDSSLSALGGQAQLVNGDDFLYDDDFDV